ncbi:MAG: DedA family protein [Ancalomicrobiaceae bacterium]|nr:DedA family protein [Ancalomicrobiaceae bacterium]
MLKRLYDWTFSLAASEAAEWWLAVIAFVESSVFLIPADVLFVPMSIARPQRAYRYALIATVASVAGGIAGWYIGFYAFEAIARPILVFYDKLAAFEDLKTAWGDSVLLLLITSGIAHLPPIKVVTILSGVVHVNLWVFIASAIAARGARFFALGWALKRWGDAIRHFIEHRLGLVAGIIAGVIILAFAALKLAH